VVVVVQVATYQIQPLYFSQQVIQLLLVVVVPQLHKVQHLLDLVYPLRVAVKAAMLMDQAALVVLAVVAAVVQLVDQAVLVLQAKVLLVVTLLDQEMLDHQVVALVKQPLYIQQETV
jgi:hypothetical protein